MAISDQDIFDWFVANPEANDEAIAAAMGTFDVSLADIARATGTEDRTAEYGSRLENVLNSTTPPEDTASFLNTITSGAGNMGLSTVDTGEQPTVDTVGTNFNTSTGDARTIGSADMGYLDSAYSSDSNLINLDTGMFKPVDLGDGTFRTHSGNIIDADGLPVTNSTGTTFNVYDAITKAWNAGDYAATNDLLTQGKITGEDLKSYYGISDDVLKFVLSQGVTPASSYTSSDWPTIISGTTGTDGEVLTRTTASDGTPFYLHDASEGVYYQNPATVESYAPFTGADGKTYYNVYAPTFSSGLDWDKTPITATLTEAQYQALKGGDSAIKNLINSPVGSFALNILGPWGQVINAANAIDNGNITGAVLSSLNAAQGFGVTNLGGFAIKDIQNVARGLNAVDQKNWAGAFTAGSNLVGGTSGDFTTAANLASAGFALSKNDAAGFASAMADLTNTPDLKIAAAATRLLNAVSSDTINPAALQSAFNALGTAINKSSTASTGTKVSDAGDEVALPTGVQLASAGDGVFRTDVGGTPTFAESKNAGSVTAPFGYTLLSSKEADNKPEGAYYDITANAWFKPDTAVTDLTGSATIKSDADLLTSTQGDLDTIATLLDATGGTGLTDGKLNDQDLLDLVGASTVTGAKGNDIITGATGNDTIQGGTGGDTLVGAAGNDTITGGTGKDTLTGGDTNDTLKGGDGNDTLTGGDTNDTIKGADGNDVIVDDKGTVTVIGGKESCPIGTTLNPETGECDAIVAVDCADGYHDDGTGLCVPNDDKKVSTECAAGQVRDLTTGECVWPAEECAEGYHDDGTGLCVPDDDTLTCPEGYEPNEAGTACVEVTTIIGKKESCPVGTQLNPETGECDPIVATKCADGYHDDGTGLCVPNDEKCADGYHKDESGACVPDECPEGYVRNLATGVCEKPLVCEEGFELNDAGTECIPVINIKSCPTGQHRDETGKCVPDTKECAEGFHLDEATGLCVADEDECEEGYHRENGVCVPDECPEGYIRNLETGVCEKVEKECPPGQVKDANGKCVPITKTTECKPGFEKVDGVCVPICKPGYQRVNGVCVLICKPGYQLVNGVCVPIPTGAPISAAGGEGEKTDPIYAGGMDDFNLLATLEELLASEAPKKDTKKSKDKTKMASGGYLDDLLAEQMTVDDLLKLLR
jgi:hypothetical protein